MYVIGGLGGFMGADGVNPIELLVLVGDAGRVWFESHYFDVSIAPIGKVRITVPPSPNHPDSLLDACIAFCPGYFRSCPSLPEVETALKEFDRLDFDTSPEVIPVAWIRLREEARPICASMNIWSADLLPWTGNR